MIKAADAYPHLPTITSLIYNGTKLFFERMKARFRTWSSRMKQAVTFDRVLVHTGCGECRRTGMPFVKLRTRGTYEINFSGNISGAVAGTSVQLAIALGGVGLPETVMEYTPSVANSFGNVSTGTFVRECCEGCDQITVINTGTVAVTLSANMNLRIKRLS